MELLRGVSAANNFVLALVPLLSSRLLIVDHDPAAAAAAMPKTTMMSWLTDRPARGAAITGQRRRGGGATPGLGLLCDCKVQRRRVRVPIRGRNMASQVLLG